MAIHRSLCFKIQFYFYRSMYTDLVNDSITVRHSLKKISVSLVTNTVYERTETVSLRVLRVTKKV